MCFKIYSSFQCEKYLLRQSFNQLLPKVVLWRTKEAFSDGVSTYKRSWYQIIQEYTDSLVISKPHSNYLPPISTESSWFRMLFDQFYPKRERVVPYFWLPKWCGIVTDPSARTLSIY